MARPTSLPKVYFSMSVTGVAKVWSMLLKVFFKIIIPITAFKLVFSVVPTALVSKTRSDVYQTSSRLWFIVVLNDAGLGLKQS